MNINEIREFIRQWQPAYENLFENAWKDIQSGVLLKQKEGIKTLHVIAEKMIEDRKERIDEIFETRRKLMEALKAQNKFLQEAQRLKSINNTISANNALKFGRLMFDAGISEAVYIMHEATLKRLENHLPNKAAILQILDLAKLIINEVHKK